MKTKVKELLEYISQSTMSMTNARIRPKELDKVTYTNPQTSQETINSNITYFEYNIPNKEVSDKRFKVEIYKVHNKSFWGKDTSKYITKILISLPSNYSSARHIETIEYCSWLDTDTYDIQKGMFNYLELKNSEAEINEENQKYEDYIKDIKKTINISIARDNKLNNILEEKDESQS